MSIHAHVCANVCPHVCPQSLLKPFSVTLQHSQFRTRYNENTKYSASGSFLLDAQSPIHGIFTGSLCDLMFGHQVCPARPLANPHHLVNSKEITAGIDCSHKLSGCQDISSQSFMLHGCCASDVVRCRPMWADVAGHTPTSGRYFAVFGSENPTPRFMPLIERSRATDLSMSKK